MKLKTIIIFLTFCFLGTNFAYAQSQQNNPLDGTINAYRFYKDLNSLSLTVPTVVEVPFNQDSIENFNFAVVDNNASSFQPYFFKDEPITEQIPVSVDAMPTETMPADTTPKAMIDNDLKTFTEFSLPEDKNGYVQITHYSPTAITSSSLTLTLDKNVAYPDSIEIKAYVGKDNKIVLSNKKITGNIINFPTTSSERWEFIFTYSQPLRISEIKLNQISTTKENNRTIRFLAQPHHTYRIYFDADRTMTPQTGETGNLISAKDVYAVPEISTLPNPGFTESDQDKDGIIDKNDNCVSIANPDQLDTNNNKKGDACEDFDLDGIINANDNCPNDPNSTQLDSDNDKIGDVCDKEESRITEKYPWMPWVGIGFAGLVLITLLVLTARSTEIKK